LEDEMRYAVEFVNGLRDSRIENLLISLPIDTLIFQFALFEFQQKMVSLSLN